MGGIARGGRGSSGEGESGGEDESGVRARMRVRVRSRRRARHSAHRGRHDRRQLESEALSRHDALGHCDVHGALRRADLQLACGRTHTAHTADALWAVPPATEHTVAQHGTGRHCFGVTYSTWQPTAGSHALRHLHLHRALHGALRRVPRPQCTTLVVTHTCTTCEGRHARTFCVVYVRRSTLELLAPSS